MLRGLTFALSTHGDSQKELEELIVAQGGSVARFVHARVSLLLATDAALTNNTQAVRKGRKFGVPIVRPAFLRDSVAASRLLDVEDPIYAPKEDAAGSVGASACSTADEAAPPRGAGAPALEAVGLSSNEVIEVLVEMSDEPTLQWWPARVSAGGTSASGRQGLHSLVYQPLATRGYEDEVASRARFDPERDRLWDADEAIWRPWRRLAAAAAAAAPNPKPTALKAGHENHESVVEGAPKSSASGIRKKRRRRKEKRRRGAC